MKSGFKRLLVVMPLCLVSAALAFASFAWLSVDIGAGIYHELSKPKDLAILGPDEQQLDYINLGSIDLDNDNSLAQYIFCVKGDKPSGAYTYYVELAYTTNINFSYNLYRVSKDAPTALCTEIYTGQVLPNAYYYEPTALTLTKKNVSDDNRTANKTATDTYYIGTYGTTPTSEVQKNAMPIYADAAVDCRINDAGSFVEYFMLEVSWNNISNNKEADMVYILAISDAS